MTVSGLPVAQRFANFVSPEPNTGCWLWAGALNSAGYAVLNVGGVATLGHRLGYEINVGPIPDGADLDHRCRVKCCVNPAHVEPVTHAENMRRYREATSMPRGCSAHSPDASRRRCLRCGRLLSFPEAA